MTTSLHAIAIDTFVHGLQTLAHLLDRGAEKLDAEKLPELRLAPDMHPLARQVQFVCLQALDAAARLAGRTPPTPEPAEETLAQLKDRIAATLAALRDIPAGALRTRLSAARSHGDAEGEFCGEGHHHPLVRNTNRLPVPVAFWLLAMFYFLLFSKRGG